MEQQQGTLKLCVLNTFLHVKDEDEDVRKLARSASDSSLHSSIHSGSSSRRTPEQVGVSGAMLSTSTDSSSWGRGPSPAMGVGAQASSPGLILRSREQAVRPPVNSQDELGHIVFGSDSESSRSHTGYPATLPDTADVPKNWSQGSELHHLGQCDPCAFHTRAAGCTNGAECTFCHACPAEALQRKRKANRKIEKRRGQEEKLLLTL